MQTNQGNRPKRSAVRHNVPLENRLVDDYNAPRSNVTARPYACDACGKRYATIEARNTHYDAVHYRKAVATAKQRQIILTSKQAARQSGLGKLGELIGERK